MKTLVIDKKKYVVIEQYDYQRLLKKAALKNTPARKLTLAAGKQKAYALIDKWHKEK